MSYQKEKLRNEFHLQCNATERIKYLGINLTKEIKDLYTEDQNILLKLK